MSRFVLLFRQQLSTPEQAKQFVRNQPEHLQRVELFNNKLKEALLNREKKFFLSFDQFGYDHEDIQFIRDIGYKVYRDSACLWWEVDIQELY